ncbi:RHS repeat domain-containing protein [Rhizobium sp. Leaf371]|uniref:RHS repeat domain-containing protein n=1 Tax=Rhizobium sp. Leaf371 TaxID=1736355 RepID=UPI001FCD14DF|nr:RHS repeat domain-containing protein [Rhizobium sp. Leaf371]
MNALGHDKRYVEDDEGRVATEIDGEGNETRYGYDGAGHVKSIRDPTGRSTYYGWTSEGDLELVIDNAGKSWELYYDDFGSLTMVKNPLGEISEIRCNSTGQAIGIIRHDGLIEQNSYDEHHWLVETLDFAMLGRSSKGTRSGGSSN